MLVSCILPLENRVPYMRRGAPERVILSPAPADFSAISGAWLGTRAPGFVRVVGFEGGDMRRTARVHPGEDYDIFKIRFRNTPPAKSESMGGWGRGWSARWSGPTKTARTAQRGFNPG